MFSVLDGQQRLTTLFLLHWFLAVKNKDLTEFRQRFMTDDGQSRFTYKTRSSSTEFFNALVKYGEVKLTSEKTDCSFEPSIKDLVCDSKWFYLAWKQDPTVQACLYMLDAIEDKFSLAEGDLYKRITNIDSPYITFQFLPLESFGLSDELYIKMNARGKPLTSFENFKAKFEKSIKLCIELLPKYQLDFKEVKVNSYEYFIHKIDTNWADLFWSYRNKSNNTFDEEIMNFIRLIILYQYLLNYKANSERITQDIKLFLDNNKLRAVSISEYKKQKCFDPKLIIRLIDILDLLENKGHNQIKTYLPEQKYYAESDIFKKIIADDTTYSQKLRFYAFYCYLSKRPKAAQSFHDGLAQPDLAQWMRVVYNLTENSNIDSALNFYLALLSIEKLNESKTTVLSLLKNNPNLQIKNFSPEQVLEEKIKAHLILKSTDWQLAVIEAENHSYFKGQIGFLLEFSGILSFYEQHKHCEWDITRNKHFINQFKKYAESASNTFSMSNDSKYLWERAVLCKGEYFISRGSERFSLLSVRTTRQNINRDYSWHRLLRLDIKTVKERGYVKAVFDDPNFNCNSEDDLKSSLQVICDKSVEESPFEYWREAFIRYPQIFERCTLGFIAVIGKEIFLYNQYQRNHLHSELYTKILEIKILEIKIDYPDLLKPFSRLDYIQVRSGYESAGLHIKDWDFKNQAFSIEIIKEADHFNIYFKNNTPNSYPENISIILLELGFEYIETDLELNLDTIASLTYFTDTKQTTVDDVIIKLKHLCEKIRNINDE
ncbi:DUF262 domain-containing protein [Psychrobacter immobilis]|uniref:GmrSD restriction endonuclease domain-containing protein n=1 Tax=Psychrobacter immobilis TaxID=498 RepID=UPI001D0FA4DD|nr:DUF262 domain-containing protein [Psychrobacter immobilis]